MSTRHVSSLLVTLLALAALVLAGPPVLAGTKALTFEDLMRFRQIDATVLSENGAVVAYAVSPDRGDGEAIVRLTGRAGEWRVERGADPQVSLDGAVVALAVAPPFAEVLAYDKEHADDEKDDDEDAGPRKHLAVVRTAASATLELGEARSFALSRDGRHVAWLAYREIDDDESEAGDEAAEPEDAETPAAAAGEAARTENADEPVCPGDECKRTVGRTLTLRSLVDEREATFEHVVEFAFDHDSRVLAFTRGTPDGVGNGVFVVSLAAAAEPRAVQSADAVRALHLAWPEGPGRLAFTTADEADDGELTATSLWTWQPGDDAATRRVAADAMPTGLAIPEKSKLVWTRDGERLFVRLGPEPKPDDEDDEPADGDDRPLPDPFDRAATREDVTLDVWHWQDPRIKTHERVWKDKSENLWTTAVLHDDGVFVVLGDDTVEDIEIVQDPAATLGYAPGPYLRAGTWQGFYRDAFRIDLRDGSRTLVARRIDGRLSLAPGGRWAVYWSDGDWHLFDASSGATRNLTGGLERSFANEDHDYPAPVPGYGVADWIDDTAVILEDKFDLWAFPVADGAPERLTRGREDDTIFRLVDTDPKRDFVRRGEPLVLRSYHDHLKSFGFHGAVAGQAGTRPLLTGDARFDFVAKAEAADVVLSTRQRYDEFPDLWVSAMSFDNPRRLSDVNPQIADYAWGRAELVEWRSADGVPLQGVLIRPGDHEPGKRYPVLVYFYRFFSQRLHEFNEPVVNHRPSFPMYASNGYAVFLPDVRFDVGLPGPSAVKCLVPGVQKLVEMGLADPERIGLHGHSWSGYQAAYVVTQTDIFAAAAPGAPVSNMTSAYSGIRLESGLARQFQYEQYQSRIGASLWQARDLYIENSPVFFADRIETPLLIQFGDRDEAVPWQQGIEFFLALRRLGKPAVMLQYRDEPHHLKQYPNKLDYSIKMMEFFDHFLKGAPAPAWWTEGVAYEPE